jgi:two-component system, cell cycle sensor histidine kinase and response regulator CckA
MSISPRIIEHGPRLHQIASVIGFTTFLIGVLGILGWIPGLRVFVGIRPDYISIAPVTAAAFILFGLIMVLLVRKPLNGGKKILVLTLLSFISVYGLLEFIGYFANVQLTLDSFLFPTTEKLGPFDLRRMSPIPGILFFLSGVSLQLNVLSENRLKILNGAGGYGFITLFVGFIATIGYVFGTPLLYGGTMIPIAANTAIGFMIMGGGLVAMAGPKTFIMRPFVGSSTSARMLRVLVPLIVAAILVEGYLREVFMEVFAMNHALLSALLSVIFALVTSVLVFQIARGVFRKADIVEIERQQAQHDLAASEIRYRRLFESAKDGILILNAESGEVIDVNPFMIDMLGYARGTYLGKSFWDITFFKEVAASKIDFIELQKKEYVHFEDLPLTTNDGRKVDVEFVITAYRVDATSVIQCNIRDITGRKRAEESLMLQNAALQSAANAIVITDREGKIISINKAFSILTGFTQDEVLGHKLNILKSGNQPLSFYQNLWKTIISGEVWKGELENKRKDGSFYTEEMTITPVRQAHGEISHFISIKQDITERKRFQQELLQSQKIQSIGTLAGGVAHDFNNILAIILIYATLLERSAENREKVVESSRAISRAVDRGKELVRQILTFARKTDVVFEPMSIADLIDELLSMLKQTFPKTITFAEDIEKDISFISADRAQIHQAILNLCVNARDAMPKGGLITVKAEKQQRALVQNRFPAADQDSYICVSVADTGEGIEKAILLRIFDPFFTTKEMGKGTGLGLAVVYGVMQSHHGFVEVDSTPGHGTIFRLYFPVSLMSEHIAGVPSAVEAYHIGGSETILLVEDEELLLESVHHLLESKGYKVYVAQDGKEAVKLFREHKQNIDLVLTDLGLPGISGKEEFAKLKEINLEVKVIMASGFFEPDVKSELLKAGVKGFIQKPYVPDEILRIIRFVLDTV